MEVDHFSHEHRLTFIENEKQISRKHRKKNIICKGCQKFCTFPLYACTQTQCSFYLHKSCAEFPTEFQNPFHPHGPLTLCFDPNKSFPCRACFRSCNGFYFHCEVCNFVLHLDCAFLMTTAEEEQQQQGCKQLQHFIHLHPLVLVDKKDEVVNRVKCHICGEHCFGACYGCDPCGIFLHKPCAEFQYPQEIQNFTHTCPLTLQTRVHPFRCQACDTCMMSISYHCEQCWFDIDVECALLRSIKSDDGKQIKHFNHRHPLTLIEKSGDGDQVHCFACGQGCLGTTYYLCNRYEGEFSLHESCADSAPTIYDYLHPDHPLSLLLRPTNTTPVRFRCNACRGDCCDLTYRCELCDFNLHVECTGQVPTIKYENHRHLLLLAPKMGAEAKCHACESTCDSLIFRCPQCDFNLHVQCGPLPYIIKHKCHVDSLTLTDSPVEDDSDDEFYCDVCEEERNPRFPFYYCAGCQFVAEVSCVISEVMLWLEGEYGDVELRSPEGKFAGKVISERTEAMEMCKKEAAEATKILNDPVAEEMQALHDQLTLDRLLNYEKENEMRQMEVAQGIRRQIKPQTRGTGVLTWNHILSSFSKDERKELRKVRMTKEVQEESIDEENSSEDEELKEVIKTEDVQVESIDEENSSEDELDSLDNSLFLDKAFTDLKQKLGSGPKELMDLWNRKEQVVNVRDYLVPQSLAPILESLLEKYGDVGAETNLSSRVKMYLIVTLCGTIDSLCCTRILDITEDKLLNWMQYLRALEYAGFKIQFVHDQWTRVTKAYFGLRLRKLEDDTLQELETDITKYDAEVKGLTTKLELIKDKHERITSEKSGKRSSLIEDCLRAAAKLKWKKAGAGLIKLG